MENRFQRILLMAVAAACVVSIPMARAATDPKELELEPLVVREPDRRQVEVDQLDSENIEVGVFAGILSVQDFGSDTVAGHKALDDFHA